MIICWSKKHSSHIQEWSQENNSKCSGNELACLVLGSTAQNKVTLGIHQLDYDGTPSTQDTAESTINSAMMGY